MKKLIVLFLATILIIPATIRADEPLWGPVDANLSQEINENTDLIAYMLGKQNVTKDDVHTSIETINNLIRRSCSGMVMPHFVQCWEDPFYFPRFVKRVVNDLSKSWNDPNDLGMYNLLVSSEIRNGYLSGGFPQYLPQMEADPKTPLLSAIKKMYKDEGKLDLVEGESVTIVMQIGNKIMTVNGVEKSINPPPQIINGGTMVPARAIADALGAKVDYIAHTKTMIISNGQTTIEFQVGSDVGIVNGVQVPFKPAALIKEGKTLVPFRFIFGSLGATVDFNASEKKITILYKNVKPVEELNNLAIKDIPLELQIPIAKYLLAMHHSAKYSKRALRKLPPGRLNDLYNLGRYQFLSTKDYDNKELIDKITALLPEDQTELQIDMAREYDYNDLYYGAFPLVMETIGMKKFLKNPKTPDTKDASGNVIPGKVIDINRAFELLTPYGTFKFSGTNTSDTYDGYKYFSVVDVAGNDKYTGPVAATLPERLVSTVIDMNGDDTYTSTKDDPCSQGFGMLGVGFLNDYGGNDTYTSYDNSQGGCFFGIGYLWEEGGNDSFSGRNMNQGAASYGTGTLVNVGGNDRYYCFQVGQAFGFCGGTGILVDTEGDDTYIGEPGKTDPEKNLINPATGGHDNNRNYSFVQGAGWGRRADMSDGQGIGGGNGILVDVAGNDKYECGVYGQSTGYWFGTGILCDMAGDDHYEGSFFVQSGTAHMGLTELLDEKGNDTYKVWKAISQGGAHDFSVSWFIDKEGNDKYEMYEMVDGQKTSGGVLCGSAITNSVAVHIDYGGDDTYDLVNSSSLGYCLLRSGPVPDNYRYEEWTAGIFINRGGNDTYTRTLETNAPKGWPEPKNNAMWKEVTQPGNLLKSLGFGLDVETGKVIEAEW
jgi:hypothetical protein